VVQRKIVLYVPDDLSISIKPLLQQNNCNVLRDLPYCSHQILEDTVELRPDVVILSEYINWDKTDLLHTVRYIRTNCSTTQIIAHVRERRVGDSLLHDLVSLVVYDILLNVEFNIREILKMIEHPSSYADVRHYHNFSKDEDSQLPVVTEQQRSILTKWEEADPIIEVDNNVPSVKGRFFAQGIKALLQDKEEYLQRLKRIFVTEPQFVKQEIAWNIKPITNNQGTSKTRKVFESIPEMDDKQQNKQIQRISPTIEKKRNNRLILVIGTDRYVGTTTVTVNLARQGQIIYYPEGYNQEISWPTSQISAESINMRDWVKWINLNESKERLIDCGYYTKMLDPWIAKADIVFLIAENRSKCLESASSIKLTTRTRLIINKATPDGIKPIILSRALNIPYSAVIPYDTEYRHNFGLALNRTSWNTLRDIAEKITEERKG